MPYFVFSQIYIGPVALYTWGLFVGLAFTAGYLLMIFRGRQKNIPQEKIMALSVVTFLGAVIGSRLDFLLQNPTQFLNDISLFWRWNQGGLMLYGGIIGAIIAGGLYARWAKLGFWRMADLVAPATALGIGIGRLGCFLVNDHIGAPTSLPWGILWPDGVVRHPVALYESLAGLGLFIVLLSVAKYFTWRSRLEAAAPPTNPNVIPAKAEIRESGFRLVGRDDKKEGNLFLFFLASYSIFRFFFDFFRASDSLLADPRWWGLTTSQWISVIIVFLVSVVYYLNRKKKIFFKGDKNSDF